MRKTNHNVQRAVPPSHNNNMKWQLDFEENEEGDDGTWMTERCLSDVSKNVTFLGQTPANHPMQMDCHICSKRRGRERKTTTYKCKE